MGPRVDRRVAELAIYVSGHAVDRNGTTELVFPQWIDEDDPTAKLDRELHGARHGPLLSPLLLAARL